MKLVPEHINEFERGLDPKSAMQIGDKTTRINHAIEKIKEDKNVTAVYIETSYKIPVRMKICFIHEHMRYRSDYAKKLVGNTGILYFFEDEIKTEYHKIQNIIFKIKPEFKEYFEIAIKMKHNI
ncbi:MAG: hypothetical protein WC554_14975 [Clostridia bacterium]